MRTVLHIGIAKTGTTFLQNWMSANREALSSSGILPLSSLSSHRLAVECICDPITARREDIIWIKKHKTLHDVSAELIELFSKYASAKKLVISSEYFSILNPLHVYSLLLRFGLSIDSVIIYLRRQDLYAAAGYAQDVKALHQGLPFSDLINAPYTADLHWDLLYRTWSNSFERSSIMVRNYDKYKFGHGLIIDFISLIGSSRLEQYVTPSRDYPSLDCERTEAARLLNLRQQTFDLDGLIEMQTKDPKPPFGLSRESTRLFEEKYLTSNRVLAEVFPGEFDNLASTCWMPQGVDMTGLVTEERLAEIVRDMQR